ncbi:MAG: hypothetical protein Q7R79_02175 [bacterium]|nr:hypothetical protein [bacterium]
MHEENVMGKEGCCGGGCCDDEEKMTCSDGVCGGCTPENVCHTDEEKQVVQEQEKKEV